MTERREQATSRQHLAFLDNIRTFIVFLVVVYHAGGVYESSGIWAQFWLVVDPATNDLVGLLNLVLDVFMMPTLFFVSGYLAQSSLLTKGEWIFVVGRFKRLIVPWIVAVLTLIPMYRMIFLHSRGWPQTEWSSYFHFANEAVTLNWLWFLPVLFLFDVGYSVLSRAGVRPDRLQFRHAVVAMALLVFVMTLGMDLMSLRGWTHSWLIDFQNERLPVYFLVFLLGSTASREGVLMSQPRAKRLYIVVNCVAWIPTTSYVVFFLVPYVVENGILIGALIDRVLLWASFTLSLVCFVYLIVETFRRYFDHSGVILAVLSRNTYYVYIVHVIVLGGIALLLVEVAIPSVAKFLMLGVSTYLASSIIAHGVRLAEVISSVRIAGR